MITQLHFSEAMHIYIRIVMSRYVSNFYIKTEEI